MKRSTKNRIKGGYKTREKNLAKDPDYYRKMGAIGGRISRGGFTKGSEAAREAGRKGGLVKRAIVL